MGLPLSFEPQPDRMSHRCRPGHGVTDRLYTGLDDGLALANKYKLEQSATGTTCT